SADVTLSSADIHDGVFSVEVAGPTARFSFVGQNGQVKRVARDTTRASYTLLNGDSYIRTVVETPARILYLNPIIRYDGAAVPWPSARIDPWVTAVQRVAVLAVCALLTLSLVRRIRGTRRGSGRARRLPRVAALVVSIAAAIQGRAHAQEVPRPLPT